MQCVPLLDSLKLQKKLQKRKAFHGQEQTFAEANCVILHKNSETCCELPRQPWQPLLAQYYSRTSAVQSDLELRAGMALKYKL